VENASIESFNGRLRDKCLNVHQFMSLDDARAIIEAWRGDYNHRRPHSSLRHLTPNEFIDPASGPTNLLKQSSGLVKNCLVTGPTSLSSYSGFNLPSFPGRRQLAYGSERWKTDSMRPTLWKTKTEGGSELISSLFYEK
jgi:hypothetical protein